MLSIYLNMEAIYAIDSKCGLSKNGKLAWSSKTDMQFFKNKTENQLVIMGKNTYFSLPERARPLPRRLNIVLTHNPEKYIEEYNENSDHVIFTADDDIHHFILNNREAFIQRYPYLNPDFKIMIIGGKNIYEQFLPFCEIIWMSRFKQDYSCDLFLDYSLDSLESEKVMETEELTIHKYTRSQLQNGI